MVVVFWEREKERVCVRVCVYSYEVVVHTIV